MRQPANHTIGQEIAGVIFFLGVIWSVFLVELVSPVDLKSFGLIPRTADGLVGIVTMPFLHANLQHIVSNTMPLVVLLVLLAGSRARSWVVVAEVISLSGGLLWMFGRYATHIGASGLICGLITFLIVSGIRERRIVPLFVSVVVGFLYGSTLLAGIVPNSDSTISWDGHLCGALAGVAVARLQGE